MLSLLAAPGVPIRWLEEDFDRENAKKSLSALFNSSLCQTSTDNRKALIHRLQGRAFRENHLINETEKEYILTSIIQSLENVVTHTSYNPPKEREEVYDLIEQLGAIASQEYSQPLFTKPAMATILERTLRTALELGMYQAALTLVNSVAKASDTLGADHPDILSSRKSLADAYLLEGQVKKAIALLEQNLKHSKTIPDTAHHNTRKPRNSFMSTLRAGDRINKATTPHQQIQKDHPHALGPDHAEIFASRNNLAGAYREAGRLEDAITLYQQNFVDTDYFLGPDHPYTLASRNNLANAYQEAGRLEDAITLYRQNLQDRTRLVGPNHPDTLATRNNLANAYRDAGKIEEAIPLLEQNLKDCTHILGPDHPHTLLSRNNLANAYQTAGRLDEAIPLLEQNLKDCTHILGPDHPDTLFTRDNFACAYQATDRLNEATTLLERNLKGCTRILGPHHPHTLNTRHRLADAYRAAGRTEEAEALFETPSDSEDEQNGADDPDQDDDN